MKKAKRILLSMGIGLLVLIIVTAIVVGLFLDKIVKAGVERVGPKITQTTITVDTVNLSLLTGSARVKNLDVGSPEGYKAPNAISVGLATVSVSPMSVLSDTIVVKSVRVESPDITFEGSLSRNNLNRIVENVNGVAKNGGPESTNKTAAAGNKPGKRIEVDDLLITGAKVHGTLTLFGGKEVTIPSLTLPDIELHDLGKGSEGITATDLTKQVLSAVVSGTIKA
ncbi:MAG TPA: AsmA family protein, partial [Verrucomicrobiae bacterium]